MNINDWPVTDPRVAGDSWLSIKERLYIIDNLTPNSCLLEIGTANGSTAALIAMQRPDVKIVCVDNWKDEILEPRLGSGFQRRKNWHRNKQPNMQLYCGTLQSFLYDVNLQPSDPRNQLFPSEFNFIFIDGDHHYNSVMDDLRDATYLLRETGQIMVHDYNLTDGSWPEVKIAVDDFLALDEGETIQLGQIVGASAILEWI